MDTFDMINTIVRDAIENSKLFNYTSKSENDYNMSIVADWFHSIPHFDIKLQKIQNTTFDPNNNEYLESLGILIALPGFWLILTLLFFLIFFLCRCCDASSSGKEKKKLTGCKFCLFIFAIISFGTITVGVFGNWLSHTGVIKVQNSAQDVSNVINGIKNHSFDIEESLRDIDKEVEKMTNLITKTPLVKDHSIVSMLTEELNFISRNITKGVKKISEVRDKYNRLNPQIVPTYIDKVEKIRWPSTFGLLGSLVFICLILIVGIFRHSRCVLILFSVLGLLSLVICWVISSVYLGATVAGSDFCVNPKAFIYKQLNNTFVEGKILRYYLNCDEISPGRNPYTKILEDVQEAIKKITSSINKIELICTKRSKCSADEIERSIKTSKNELEEISESLGGVFDLLSCGRINQDYLDAMSGLCKDLIEGVAIMLVSAASAGLCFTILVLCASHTWINIRKKRQTILEPTEETDPFLPPASATSTASSANSKRLRDPYGTGSSGRPRFSHTPPQTPHFPPPTSTPPSALNGRSLNRDDQLSFLSPPPAYEQVGPILHNQHVHHHHQQHQSIGPHYVADTDLMMRATQATKF